MSSQLINPIFPLENLVGQAANLAVQPADSVGQPANQPANTVVMPANLSPPSHSATLPPSTNSLLDSHSTVRENTRT